MESITGNSLITKYPQDECAWTEGANWYDMNLIVYFWFPGAFSSSCPPNWITHKNNCYLFSTSLASWNRSKRHCSQLHSNLLKIDTAEELVSVSFSYNYLWSMLSRKIEVEGEMESQEDSALSAEPDARLDLKTLRSQSEPKSRGRYLSNCATQGPPYVSL